MLKSYYLQILMIKMGKLKIITLLCFSQSLIHLLSMETGLLTYNEKMSQIEEMGNASASNRCDILQ